VDYGGLNARIGRAVRELRFERGLDSAAELADAAGLSKSIVARIEKGEGNPSVETLWRISKALDVPMGVLLAEDAQPRTRVIAARSGAAVAASRSAMHGWAIHAEGRAHRSELHEIEWPAGAEQRADAHAPGTEEVVFCISGTITVGPLGEEAELGPGDALWFVADGPHRYAAGKRGARALNLLLYLSPAGAG
jgi:transcriptional regulator with XRE-family HTH domain